MKRRRVLRDTERPPTVARKAGSPSQVRLDHRDHARGGSPALHAGSRPSEILDLQRSVGNRAVQRLVDSSAASRGRSVIQRNAKFDTITGPPVELEGAPKELAIPKEAKDGMQLAWATSFPGGKSQEQGGILVQTKEGKYEWRAGPPGTSGSFMPNYGDVREGETLIASGHTHPYDESEGGATNIAFSGGDLGHMIFSPSPTMVVQSGDGFFVLAKTKEFEEMVAERDTREKKMELYREMDGAWDTEFAAASKEGLDFKEAVEKAAGIVCDRYHLLHYAGGNESVKKQNEEKPEVHVEVEPIATPPSTATTTTPTPTPEEESSEDVEDTEPTPESTAPPKQGVSATVKGVRIGKTRVYNAAGKVVGNVGKGVVLNVNWDPSPSMVKTSKGTKPLIKINGPAGVNLAKGADGGDLWISSRRVTVVGSK